MKKKKIVVIIFGVDTLRHRNRAKKKRITILIDFGCEREEKKRCYAIWFDQMLARGHTFHGIAQINCSFSFFFLSICFQRNKLIHLRHLSSACEWCVCLMCALKSRWGCLLHWNRVIFTLDVFARVRIRKCYLLN